MKEETTGKTEKRGENTLKVRDPHDTVAQAEARLCIESFTLARERLRDYEMLYSLLMSKKAAPDPGDKRLLEGFNRSTNIINAKVDDLEKNIIKLLLEEKEGK